MRYRQADAEVCALFLSLRHLAESRSLEIHEVTRQFLEARGALEPVDRAALVHRVLAGEVTLLDVRSSEEYEAGHIKGAMSIPRKELKRRLADLPRDRDVIAYCRGPYCLLAVKAVEILNRSGFRATRLSDGVMDWRDRGLTVETTTR